MGGSNFEQLIGEILNQKQLMDELLTENYELRRQLADLRDGRGIFLEIQGQRFSLADEIDPTSPQVESISQEAFLNDQPTTIMPINEVGVAASTTSEMPLPATDQIEQLPYSLNQEQEEAPTTASSFLEEMLIDEFAATATSQLAVWQGSKTKKLALTDEEEKAVLRKQLVGSFLLE